jgi:hypothetical protein
VDSIMAYGEIPRSLANMQLYALYFKHHVLKSVQSEVCHELAIWSESSPMASLARLRYWKSLGTCMTMMCPPPATCDV